jgi:uncharacterized protein (DUF1684 family)
MSTDINELTLLDWKRRVFELYARIRRSTAPQEAWREWRDERDRLFREHPQSPLPPSERTAFAGLPYFGYNPSLRVPATVTPADRSRLEIATSDDASHTFVRFAQASFDLLDTPQTLSLFWLEGYGGGAFLSFVDETSGDTTYGAGRYLLDTVKGSDLGAEGDRLVLDFNFSYNPSCSYDPRWVCPLAPPENRLAVRIEGGERYPQEGPA